MRVKRDAFLYMEPTGLGTLFAQCAKCMMWTGNTVGKNPQRCHIHGENKLVTGDMTCGIYVQGKPMPDGPIMKSVTPEESGLERRAVRCRNCRYMHLAGLTHHCKLYEVLNLALPREFDLDTKIKPAGCCNANRARP